MYEINFKFFVLLFSNVEMIAQTFTYQPAKPKAGDKVVFTYNAKGSVLPGKVAPKFGVYHFNFIDNKNGVIEFSFRSKKPNLYGVFRGA